MIFTKNFQLISVLFGLSSMPACAVPEEQPSVPPTSLVPADAGADAADVLSDDKPPIPDIPCEEALRSATSLRVIMHGCNDLARETVFTDSHGNRQSYDLWPIARQRRIEEIYQRFRMGQSNLGVSCAEAVVGEDVAFGRYAMGVSYFFYANASDPSVARPILDWRPAQRAPFLDSSYGFSQMRSEAQVGSYLFVSSAPEARTTVFCDPRIGLRFLKGLNSTTSQVLLKPTAEATLASITVWAGRTLVHEPRVGYRGEPQSFPDLLRPGGWGIPENNGCHSAAAIIRQLAFSALIPVFSVGTTERDPAVQTRWDRESTGTSGTLVNISHAGLVFEGRGGARILTHADEVTTVERQWPAFPIDDAGQPLLDSRTWREGNAESILNAFWLSADQLEAQGFHVERDFPLVRSGEVGYGLINGGTDLYSRYVDFGRFAGYWRSATSDEMSSTYIPLFLRYHRVAQSAAIGSYTHFIDPFCYNNGRSFNTIIGSQISESGLTELGINRTNLLADWMMSASRIAFAYGGCEAMAPQAVASQRALPITAWRD